LTRHIIAAGAGQTRHAPYLDTGINAQVGGNLIDYFLAARGALSRGGLTRNNGLRERAAPWNAACATVCAGELLLHFVNPRVFKNVQAFTRDRYQYREEHTETRHDECGN
jgi:hypothetical protein